jgi:hypothetical protein
MMLHDEFICTRKVLKMHCKKDKEAYVNKHFAQRLEVNLLSSCLCLSCEVRICTTSCYAFRLLGQFVTAHYIVIVIGL